ncbi:DUF1501 domain-containing protein [Horticoccus sp. 23ND18S-11]|uniref:DUF1501 domain-containing protein n=1 Tax=Horticoccus sp. 23ND18S-11 TaxID=3391832 RepID=UPI0039C90514
MSKKSAPEVSRREFLGSACCAAVGATGLLSTLGSLRLMGAAASPGNGPQIPARAGAVSSDYKALVCLFLNGGNDANNLIVPLGTGAATDAASYAAYAAARSNLALPRANLLPLTPRTSDGRTWGLHPSVTELHRLFGSGQAALLANAGTLVYPTSKTQYTARSVPLPPQLFSHSDQQVQWQHSVPDKPTSTGWGGRVADLVNAFNSSDQISMSISIAGKNTFQIGNKVSQYAIGTGGATTLAGSTTSLTPTNLDGIRFRAQKDLFGQGQPGLFETAFATASGDAIVSSDLLNGVLAASGTIATTFPNTTAGNQLRMAARLIAASPTLGLKRQIFFVQLGGWDLHAGQLVNTDPTTGTHAGLLAQISQAVDAFYKATTELGVANQVTLFTASDFGRTFRSNGDGSDHGWGSHHFIVGGAVKGTEIYGKMPALSVNGPDDTGLGRWIPTTSVDEYAATLATWFGVSQTDLPTVLPNIGRFQKPNLGFL